MGLFSLIMIAIAVSIDGFWGGFAFGLRKIKISPLSLVIIASWSVICTMAAMIIGSSLKYIIPMTLAKYIGGILLFLLGIYTLREGYNQKKEFKVLDPLPSQFNISIRELVNVLRNPLRADIDRENDIKPLEATILGLAVAMDASIAAFTLSLIGLNPFTTPFIFGLSHFILIGMGNNTARLSFVSHYGERFSLLPGFIILIIAILRFI